MAATHFFISGFEVGGTNGGTLQYLDETNSTWVDLGAWTSTNGVVTINPSVNPIPIDYNIFQAGETYTFRLVDADGILVSNEVSFMFPGSGGVVTPFITLDGDLEITGDDAALYSINGDGDLIYGDAPSPSSIDTDGDLILTN